MKQSKSAMGFIMVTLLIDFTGFGIIIPVLPSLIESLTGGSMATAAVYAGWLTFSYAVVQFICAPILGGLSDKYGRRPVILISLFGLGIDYLFLAFAPSIFWLFVGRIVAGIAGSSFTTAQAYIADISLPEKRAQNFGMIGAAFGIGFIIGPVIGGVFSQFGTEVPFLIAAGLSLLNWLYGYFILPESLDKSKRRNFEWKRANPIGSFLNISKYKGLAGLLVALLLLYIGAHSVESNWAFYTTEKFKWTETDIGYSLGFIGIIISIVQGGLIRLIVPKLGSKLSVFLGLSLYCGAFILFALAEKSWMMYAFIIPYALAGISGPAIQGILSNKVAADSQGEMQGLLTGLRSLGAIIGPWIMSHIFAIYIDKSNPIYFPGAPFVLAAILTFIGLMICIRSLKKFENASVKTTK